LRAACVFPFLTSIRLETVNRSTLRGQDPRIDDPSVAVMAGCDRSASTGAPRRRPRTRKPRVTKRTQDLVNRRYRAEMWTIS
jgi:hypothetical protein